jgi:hypothetical protein
MTNCRWEMAGRNPSVPFQFCGGPVQNALFQVCLCDPILRYASVYPALQWWSLVAATQSVSRGVAPTPPRNRSDIRTITEPRRRYLSLRGVAQMTVRPWRSWAVSWWAITGSEVSS